jgi:predicted transcriptional regulator
MTTKQQNRPTRDTLSARVDPEVLEIVERVAEAGRRPVSNLVRNILSDWVAARQSQQHGETA